jgi:hypothetical protein
LNPDAVTEKELLKKFLFYFQPYTGKINNVFFGVMDIHSSSHCLNCEQPLSGTYCANCGQKATTHRLSIRHFVEHDVIHGIWHIDKGILYTLKHLLTNPGTMVRNYIAGKRMGHFSLVTLLLLLVGIFLYLISFRHMPVPSYEIGWMGTDIKKDAGGLMMVIAKYSKWSLLVAVPVMGKISYDIFKQLNYNYTEHMVMCGYYFAGMLCIMIAFVGLYFIPGINSGIVLLLEIIALIAYLVVAYKQVTVGYYSSHRFALKMVLFVLGFIWYMLGLLFVATVIYMFV